MTEDAEILERERQFWLGSVEYYERWLASDAVMVFPNPVGILDRAAAIDGIRSGSRWSSVQMTDIIMHRIGRSMIALAYRARARRAGEESDYQAFVGSVYVRELSGWTLAFHQHTPASEWRNS